MIIIVDDMMHQLITAFLSSITNSIKLDALVLSFIRLETSKHCVGAKGVVSSEDKVGCSKALYFEMKTNTDADQHQRL